MPEEAIELLNVLASLSADERMREKEGVQILHLWYFTIGKHPEVHNYITENSQSCMYKIYIYIHFCFQQLVL